MGKLHAHVSHCSIDSQACASALSLLNSQWLELLSTLFIGLPPSQSSPAISSNLPSADGKHEPTEPPTTALSPDNSKCCVTGRYRLRLFILSCLTSSSSTKDESQNPLPSAFPLLTVLDCKFGQSLLKPPRAALSFPRVEPWSKLFLP